MVEEFCVLGKRVCLFGVRYSLLEPNEDNARFSLAGASGGAQEARGPAFLHCPCLVPLNFPGTRINRPFCQIQEILPPFRSLSIVPSKVPLGFCNLPHISKSATWNRIGTNSPQLRLRTLRCGADCKNREGLLEGLLKVT